MTIGQGKVVESDNSGRMVFIDVLRGIAILLVVYWHLDYFGCASSTTFLSRAAMPWRMPLFFFISGFLIYSGDYTFSLFGRRAANRIVCQLLPTVLFFLLYVWFDGSRDLLPAVRLSDKAGYWFTLAITAIFFIEAGLLVMFGCLRIRTVYKAMIFIALSAGISVLYSVVLIGHPFWDSRFSTVTSLPYIVEYLPYSLLGAVVRMYWGRVPCRMVHLCAVAAVFAYIYYYNRPYTPGNARVLALTGIIVAFYTARQIVKAVGANIMVKALQCIGSLTLEIYLLHYFAVHFMAGYEPLASLLSGELHTIRCAGACVLVAGMCLGFLKLLDIAGVRNLLFPQKASQISIKFRSKEFKLI